MLLLCGENLLSNPPATVMWLDNGGRTVEPSNSRISISDGPASVSLSLRNLTEEDSGNWTCMIAVENVGTANFTIALTVVGEVTVFRLNWP